MKVQDMLQNGAVVESPSVLTALQEIQQFTQDNTQSNRRNLKWQLQQRMLECSENMLAAFHTTQQSLLELQEEVNKMQSDVNEISQRLNNARLGASTVVKQTGDIRQKLKESQMKAEVSNKFTQCFLLTEAEERALDGSVSTAFLSALKRLETIHDNARVLLRCRNQRAGLEVLEMAAAKREDAYEKLYRFVHAQCGPLDVDANADNDEMSAHLLRESIRSLRARPVLLKYCADEVGAARRAVLVQRFVNALSKGGPGGVPKPIELHAHDVLRYTNDMLAWIHQALASEKELMYRLFGADDEQDSKDFGKSSSLSSSQQPMDETVMASHLGVGDGTDETAKSGSKEDSSAVIAGQTGISNKVLNTIFDALCRPFRVRFEQALEPLPPVVTLYKLASLLEFYASTMRGLLGENSAFPDMLLECNTVAMYAFFSSWKLKMDEFKSSGARVHDDLSPPLAVQQSMARLSEIMNTLDTSLAPAEARESQINAVVEVILLPLQKLCVAMASRSLPAIDQSIFLCNCVDALRSPLASYAFAANRFQKLTQEADSYIESYTELAAMAVLRRCGLVDRLKRLEACAEDTPLSCIPGMDLESLSISMKNFYSMVFGSGAVSLDVLSPPKVNLIQNIRMRNRAKSVVADLVAQAHESLYHAILDPKNEYGPDAAMAIGLRSPEKVTLILRGQV